MLGDVVCYCLMPKTLSSLHEFACWHLSLSDKLKKGSFSFLRSLNLIDLSLYSSNTKSILSACQAEFFCEINGCIAETPKSGKVAVFSFRMFAITATM